MNWLKTTWNKLYNFIKEAYGEFKNVSWPSRQQTIRLTAYVLGVSLGVALFVWGVDLGLKELLQKVILK